MKDTRTKLQRWVERKAKSAFRSLSKKGLIVDVNDFNALLKSGKYDYSSAWKIKHDVEKLAKVSVSNLGAVISLTDYDMARKATERYNKMVRAFNKRYEKEIKAGNVQKRYEREFTINAPNQSQEDVNSYVNRWRQYDETTSYSQYEKDEFLRRFEKGFFNRFTTSVFYGDETIEFFLSKMKEKDIKNWYYLVDYYGEESLDKALSDLARKYGFLQEWEDFVSGIEKEKVM